MNKKYINLILVSASAILIGCGGGSTATDSTTTGSTMTDSTTTDSTTTDSTTSEKDITISDNTQIEIFNEDQNLKVNIDIGNTPKDLYLLVTNSGDTSSDPAISSSAKTIKLSKSITNPTSVLPDNGKNQLRTPSYVTEFNRNRSNLLKRDNNRSLKTLSYLPTKQLDIVGDSEVFQLEMFSSSYYSTLATARKIVSNISTKYGSKTLNVWVSDDSFDSGYGCSKSRCVTQEMVDELASTFLKAGEANDIYDWVTNIYGEEWGSEPAIKYSNTIRESNEITILLTDIDKDNSPNGGAIGYFWSKDNFTNYSGSNQRVMFYIDSVMFANDDFGDYWQKEIYSTLAHEFVHMIEFYRKNMILEKTHEVWLSEMLPESTEDLIATKLEHIGPRGVDYTDGSAGDAGNTDGRYPYFNQNGINKSLTTWDDSMDDYAKVSAFGAFLTRNYGGAQLLHDIMYSSKEDESAIVEAVQNTPQGADKTFADLLREWGTAIVLSDRIDLQDIPAYNTGDFMISELNGIIYKMGSINFYNYSPTLTFSTCDEVIGNSNCYYKIGEGLTGDVSIDISLDSDVQATLISK